MRDSCPHASATVRKASARKNVDAFCNRLLFQHPEVFAAAALAGVHDEAASAEGDAAECAGDDAGLSSVEDEGTEIDVTGLELAVDDARGAGQIEHGLRYEVGRVGADLLRVLFPLFGG